jgi:hypothetical protein
MAIENWAPPILPTRALVEEVVKLIRAGDRAVAIYCEDRVERASSFVDMIRDPNFASELGLLVPLICSANRASSNGTIAANILLAAIEAFLNRHDSSQEEGASSHTIFTFPAYTKTDDQTRDRLHLRSRMHDYIHKETKVVTKIAWYFEFGGDVRDKFYDVVASAPANSTFVIDGIDEIYPAEEGDAPILPASVLPTNINLIVGVGSVEAKEKAEKLGFKIIDINELLEHEIDSFILRFLAKRLIPLTQVRLYVVAASRRIAPRFSSDCLA